MKLRRVRKKTEQNMSIVAAAMDDVCRLAPSVVDRDPPSSLYHVLIFFAEQRVSSTATVTPFQSRAG